MFSQAEWIIVLALGASFWAFVWLGKRWAHSTGGLQSTPPGHASVSSASRNALGLLLSLLFVGALLRIQKRVDPIGLPQALAIGAVASLFALPLALKNGGGKWANRVARGAWLPLGVIVVSVALFLLTTRA